MRYKVRNIGKYDAFYNDRHELIGRILTLGDDCDDIVKHSSGGWYEGGYLYDGDGNEYWFCCVQLKKVD